MQELSLPVVGRAAFSFTFKGPMFGQIHFTLVFVFFFHTNSKSNQSLQPLSLCVRFIYSMYVDVTKGTETSSELATELPTLSGVCSGG